MAIKVKDTCILRHRLTIEFSNKLPGATRSINIVLHRKYKDASWELYLPINETFTLRELIGICEAIFDSNIIGDDSFSIEGIEGQNYVMIRSKDEIEKSIIDGFKVKSNKDV